MNRIDDKYFSYYDITIDWGDKPDYNFMNLAGWK